MIGFYFIFRSEKNIKNMFLTWRMIYVYKIDQLSFLLDPRPPKPNRTEWTVNKIAVSSTRDHQKLATCDWRATTDLSPLIHGLLRLSPSTIRFNLSQPTSRETIKQKEADAHALYSVKSRPMETIVPLSIWRAECKLHMYLWPRARTGIPE